MNTDDKMPKETRLPAEVQEGSFYQKSHRDGATRFGMVAVRDNGEDDGELYPLNWPGTAPVGSRFFPAAEWPSGALKVHLNPRGCEPAPTAAEPLSYVRMASDIVSMLRDLADSRDDDRWKIAKRINDILPEISGPEEDERARAFLAGFRFANLLAEREIADLRGELSKQSKRKSLAYHDAAKLAVKLHGAKGAIELLRAIGARKLISGAAISWVDGEGKEIDVDEWNKAVKSVKQSAEK